jgi:hypothetical protein
MTIELVKRDEITDEQASLFILSLAVLEVECSELPHA